VKWESDTKRLEFLIIVSLIELFISPSSLVCVSFAFSFVDVNVQRSSSRRRITSYAVTDVVDDCRYRRTNASDGIVPPSYTTLSPPKSEEYQVIYEASTPLCFARGGIVNSSNAVRRPPYALHPLTPPVDVVVFSILTRKIVTTYR
jgi:hypothetical protein